MSAVGRPSNQNPCGVLSLPACLQQHGFFDIITQTNFWHRTVCRYTADSRAYNLHSSTLPSTANVAFLAALHAANIRAKGQSSQARPYTCWAQSQAQYMLGNHPGGRWAPGLIC